eukprot:TRINITY_DN42419_c0_g1_i1.p1 TRINITY_DN42419_c0_g1~~TRINITY_DN42419_c0_g1_i1.p1  ORF type:complete len:1000 (-),score=138.39 TRINITY_DN42419_c0_g1_i1:47-3046(-)
MATLPSKIATAPEAHRPISCNDIRPRSPGIRTRVNHSAQMMPSIITVAWPSGSSAASCVSPGRAVFIRDRSPQPVQMPQRIVSPQRIQSPLGSSSRAMRSLSPALPTKTVPVVGCLRVQSAASLRELPKADVASTPGVSPPRVLMSPSFSPGLRAPSPAAWAWGGKQASPMSQQISTPLQQAVFLRKEIETGASSKGKGVTGEDIRTFGKVLDTTPRYAIHASRGRIAVPPTTLTRGKTASSSSTRRIAPDVEHEAVLERLKVLLSDPDMVTATLQSCFEAAGGSTDGTGLVSCHAAVRAVCTAHTMLLPGLPSTCISESKWLSLLKRAGAYRPHDTVSFEQLREVQAQTLGTLRDCFAPKELLRSMRQVSRDGLRLKDRYECFEFRAKSALGKIYRCRDLNTHELFDCRQIRKDKASAPMDFIRTSLQRLAELQHPNIPTVVECLEDFHNFFIISEPMGGVEIMDFIQGSFVRSTGISEACVADIMRQILEAMAHCHSQHLGPVTHRDLQPEFVFVEVLTHQDDHTGSTNGSSAPLARQCVKASVAGFGLQPLFDLHGVGGSLPANCLPPGPRELPHLAPEAMPSSSMAEFLAPEAWSRQFGPKCDVWACGCLMFLLLTGRTPCAPRRSVKDIVKSVCEEEPDWRLFRHASTSALALCKRMLDKDDANRPTAAECLRHPWLCHSGLVSESGSERLLLPETFGSLMQFHAQSKFYQVLMNVVASEIKVGRLRRMREAFAKVDSEGSGYVTPTMLEAAFKELAVSAQTADQALRALDSSGTGNIPYTLFMAGCADLVDDKLDHMLWKVFAIVDEDHSGEIGTVVLDHFLTAALGNGEEKGEGENSARSHKSSLAAGQSGTGDVERYLQSILGANITASQAIQQIAGDRSWVTFEEVKQFVLAAASEHGSPADETSDPPTRPGLHTRKLEDEGSEMPGSPSSPVPASAQASSPQKLGSARSASARSGVPDLPTFRSSVVVGSGHSDRRERVKGRVVLHRQT